MTDEILDNYVGMEEVSLRLSIHLESARRLARRGKLPASRVGNKWLVRKDVLEEFAQRYNPRRGRRALEPVTQESSPR
jgi:excisionase family DNA binding protein